jgi:hypothetical protein
MFLWIKLLIALVEYINYTPSWRAINFGIEGGLF